MKDLRRLVAAVKSGREKRLARATEESPGDRAAALTAKATVYLAIFTVVLALVGVGTLFAVFHQLAEMESSGVQTDRLIELYRMQHAQMTRLASETHHLATSAKHQADASRTIATNAGIQSKATRDIATGTAGQLDTMQRQLELTDRPWLKIISVTPRGEHDPIKALSFQTYKLSDGTPVSQATLNFELIAKNVGKTAAMSIELGGEIFVTPWTTDQFARINAEQSRFCDKFSIARQKVIEGGRLVLPGDTNITTGALMGFIKDGDLTKRDLPGQYIYPVVIGCLDYQFQASTRHHQTRFLYYLSRSAPSGDPNLVTSYHLFEVGRGVAASDLVARKDSDQDYEN